MKKDILEKAIDIAINEAYIGIKNNHGGPFGAVIFKGNEIIAKAHNEVVKNNDPTCHGEIQAIHKACKKLKNFDLSGCELYTTGEPCGMCLVACLWANIGKVYYSMTIADNANINFRDNYFDNLLMDRSKIVNKYLNRIKSKKCNKLFKDCKNQTNKTQY